MREAKAAPRPLGCRAVYLALLLLVGACMARHSSPTRFEARAVHMAVPWVILLYADDRATAERASEAAWSAVAAIDRIASDYRSDSEIEALGAASDDALPARRKVSPELARLLREARRWAARTQGAFDPTVGPVSRLWRRARRAGRTPGEDEVKKARERVDWRAFSIDDDDWVELRLRGMRFDLGGIAKGYALDRALAALRAHGIESALIDAGGDIVCGAPPPGRDGAWKLRIATLGPPPSKEAQRAEEALLRIHDSGVATSGATHQFVEVDGVRHSHIVHAASGRALRGRKQVSIVAPDACSADALATACSVMSIEAAFELCRELEEVGVRIERIVAPGRVETRSSERFRSRRAPSACDGQLRD